MYCSVVRAVETARDGRYMVFNIRKGESFYIIRSKAGKIKGYVLLGVGILAGLLILGFIISRIVYAVRHRKKKITEADNNKEDKGQKKE